MTFIKENKDQFGLTGFNATSGMVAEIKGKMLSPRNISQRKGLDIVMIGC